MNKKYMTQALKQAELARRNGEVPVGAVLVSNGRVVAKGQNRMITWCDPTAHAEMVALRKGGEKMNNYRLLDCELYVTLEPCLMCYAAMVHARIKKLCYGADDPKTGVFSSGRFEGIKDIFNHTVEVEKGVLATDSARMLKDFFLLRRGAGAVERDGLENRCGE